MEKMIFNTEEIHAVRVDLAEHRAQMSLEEMKRDYDKRVSNGKRRIEELRREKELSKRAAE